MEKKVELKVVNISNIQEQASAFALLLQEVDGERQLPIIIGPAEAQSITFKMNNIKPIRPLTHDLFTSVLTMFDITIKEALIYKAQEGVFYSRILFRKDEQLISIDARTSDAIALALRFNASIHILESVLEKEHIVWEDKEEDTEDELSARSTESLKKELAQVIKEENYERASILRDEIKRRQ